MPYKFQFLNLRYGCFCVYHVVVLENFLGIDFTKYFCFLKQVSPGTGTIKPNQIAEVSVHLEDFPTVEEFVDGVAQNSWCEDTRDEEVILVLVVHGRFSTETRNHRIRVRHCPRGKKKYNDDRPKTSGSGQLNALHRSDYQLSNTLDVVEQLKNLHSP